MSARKGAPAGASKAAGLLESGPQGLAGLGDEDEEFDSLETVQALSAVLKSLGHQVDLLGDGEPLLRGCSTARGRTWC